MAPGSSGAVWGFQFIPAPVSFLDSPPFRQAAHTSEICLTCSLWLTSWLSFHFYVSWGCWYSGNLGPLSRKQILPGHPAWKVDRGCFHSQLSPPPPPPWPSARCVQPTLRQPPSIFTGVPPPFPPSKDFRGSPLPSVQGPPSSVCT